MPTLDGTRRRSHCSSVCTGYRGALQHKASTRKNYLTRPHKIIRLTAPVGFGTTKRLGFPLLVGMPLKPRVRLFFLTRELCCSLLWDTWDMNNFYFLFLLFSDFIGFFFFFFFSFLLDDKEACDIAVT